MASFVQQLLPRAPDNAWSMAIRLVSQPQGRTSESTPLDARDNDRNQNVWHAKPVLATTGLHLAQFRHKHRPFAKAVDYADLFIYEEAQQEAALSDLAMLGALPRKCLVLRFGDPKQTSGGTGLDRLPALLQTLLLDDLPLRTDLLKMRSLPTLWGPHLLVAILRLTHPCLLMWPVRHLHLPFSRCCCWEGGVEHGLCARWCVVEARL